MPLRDRTFVAGEGFPPIVLVQLDTELFGRALNALPGFIPLLVHYPL